jgi:hypothetical protein
VMVNKGRNIMVVEGGWEDGREEVWRGPRKRTVELVISVEALMTAEGEGMGGGRDGEGNGHKVNWKSV